MSDYLINHNDKLNNSYNSSSATYSNTKEKEIVSDFISTLFDEEKEKQNKKIVENFVCSLFEDEKPKNNSKKINDILSKKKFVVRTYAPPNKKMKYNEKNKINRIKRNNIKVKNENKDKTIDTDMYRNSLIKKILNINHQKNNFDRNKSIELRQKYNINEDNSNYVKTKEKKNNLNKKKANKTLDNHNNLTERKSNTIELTSEDTSGKKFKAKLESEKEKKECEEKIKILKNHILAMKRQQENMNKKILLLKNKEEILNNAKKAKEKTKRALYEYKIIKRDELEKKKKNIEKQREEINNGVKESVNKSKLEKSNKYKLYQKEKEELNKKNEINNAKSIIEHIQRIKAIREINKNISLNRKKLLNKNYNDINEKKFQKNIEKTKLLKEEIKQLLDEQDECLINLNKTKSQLDTMTSAKRYSTSSHKNFKSENKSNIGVFHLDYE